ncbi:hypothetical protein [Cupriavidus pauculus]|uniref:hypothetical protein n=1 Tax=Cupriavidus pauculus TaxID=82633 RepID=UPI001562894B|nr:hypothetical protein [Cupriavidus pauculus]
MDEEVVQIYRAAKLAQDLTKSGLGFRVDHATVAVERNVSPSMEALWKRLGVC